MIAKIFFRIRALKQPRGPRLLKGGEILAIIFEKNFRFSIFDAPGAELASIR